MRLGVIQIVKKKQRTRSSPRPQSPSWLWAVLKHDAFSNSQGCYLFFLRVGVFLVSTNQLNQLLTNWVRWMTHECENVWKTWSKRVKIHVKIWSKRTKNPKICAGILMIFQCDSTIIDINCMVQLLKHTPGSGPWNPLANQNCSTAPHCVSLQGKQLGMHMMKLTPNRIWFRNRLLGFPI